VPEIEEVLDAQASRLVHGKFADRSWIESANLGRLVTLGELTADKLGRKADVELLADLAVGVRDDVGGITVNTDDPGHLDS
jgi:hypothetical protein